MASVDRLPENQRMAQKRRQKREPPPFEVPSFLKQWREYRGNMTQAELGEKAGLSTTAIHNIEHQKNWFSDKSLAALARALDCTPAQLIGFNPLVEDSFLPLFEDAEKLTGARRTHAMRVIRATVAL